MAVSARVLPLRRGLGEERRKRRRSSPQRLSDEALFEVIQQPKRRSQILDKRGEPDANGCRRFIGKPDSTGYARTSIDRVNYAWHRLVWMLENDVVIPAEREIDHLCRVRDCGTAAHLQLATRQQNMARVEGPLTADAFAERARALRAGERVRPLARDQRLAFLAEVWVTEHAERGLPAARPSVKGRSADRNALVRLIESAPDETTAIAALAAMIRDWSNFVDFAAEVYDVFGGEPSRAPARPVLSALATHPGASAAIAFATESYAAHNARRRELIARLEDEAERARVDFPQHLVEEFEEETRRKAGLRRRPARW